MSVDWRVERAKQEKALLDAVGEKTDDLADEALRLVSRLPETERALFMRNVFCQLVTQSLLAADSFDDQHITRLGYGAHRRLGSQHSYIVLHDDLRSAIIDDSLPHFEQERLELGTDLV